MVDVVVTPGTAAGKTLAYFGFVSDGKRNVPEDVVPFDRSHGLGGEAIAGLPLDLCLLLHVPLRLLYSCLIV